MADTERERLMVEAERDRYRRTLREIADTSGDPQRLAPDIAGRSDSWQLLAARLGAIAMRALKTVPPLGRKFRPPAPGGYSVEARPADAEPDPAASVPQTHLDELAAAVRSRDEHIAYEIKLRAAVGCPDGDELLTFLGKHFMLPRPARGRPDAQPVPDPGRFGWDVRAFAPGLDEAAVAAAARANGYHYPESVGPAGPPGDRWAGGPLAEFMAGAVATCFDRCGAYLAGERAFTADDVRSCSVMLAFAWAACQAVVDFRTFFESLLLGDGGLTPDARCTIKNWLGHHS